MTVLTGDGTDRLSVDRKATVMLMGTFHMHNPGLDLHHGEPADILKPDKQAEIEEVVARLKAFNPTKVVVEALRSEYEALNRQYHDYLEGTFVLEANKIYQLGFRLAAELSHSAIYPLDWNEWIGGISLGDVYEYAKIHMPGLYAALQSYYRDSPAASTVRELLLAMNTPEAVRKDHEAYLTLARAGDGDSNIGVDWLCNYWYRRNLIIYSNIARISSPEDRVLVLYGAGHVHLLTQFLTESGLFYLEPVSSYLA